MESNLVLMNESNSSLHSFVARLPKVELHLHLEGAVRPETLLELARTRPAAKAKVDDWIAARRGENYRYSTFRDFLVSFGILSLLLETPQDYALITTRLIEWLAAQNVQYAEIIFAAGVVLWKKQRVDAIYEAIAEAAKETESRTGLQVQWIFDATRQFGLEHVREVMQWAAKYRSHGVIGFGIGGDEVAAPAKLFPDIFREARDRGLHCVAHAGEAAGPESIRDAVELLGAERIGHGLTAIQDASVMELLLERGIPLEVCPSSNVSTGLIARIEDHPMPQFLDAGLAVTLNSDDPAMFGTSLEEEFIRSAHAFDLRRETLIQLSRNAIDGSFLAEDRKIALRERLNSTSVT
jgi:adenosine deaminase/aminodeoxyfutalosine deaminase